MVGCLMLGLVIIAFGRLGLDDDQEDSDRSAIDWVRWPCGIVLVSFYRGRFVT